MMAALTAANIRVDGRAPKVLLLDGREKLGAKILVSGGGRCNVTNEYVHPSRFHTESDPNGDQRFKGDGLRSFVGRVLRAFSTEQTHRFFTSIGVELKLEETGKYFPVTDKARTVLDALLGAVDNSGAQLQTGRRVIDVRFDNEQQVWRVQVDNEILSSRAVIISTGGLALPKSGSDGAGFAWASAAGHTLVRTTPALTPLLAEPISHAHLSGITLPVRLKLANGSTLAQYNGSFLFTHVGYSGPVALNISRHVARERWVHPQAQVSMRLLHEVADGEEGRFWQEFVRNHAKQSVANALAEILPRRVAETIQTQSGTQSTSIGRLNTQQQKAIRTALFEAPLPVSEVASYTKAETTAGGVSLAELEPATMMSQLAPGLFFAGEVCDVDGWLGGYNFQWAWSSGVVAGRASARFALRSLPNQTG